MKRPQVNALCWRLEVAEDGEAPASGQGTILIAGHTLAIHYHGRWIIGHHMNEDRARTAALEWTKTLEVRYGAKLEAGPATFFLTVPQVDGLRTGGADLPPDIEFLLEQALEGAGAATASAPLGS